MENVKYGNLEKKECKDVRKIGKMKNDNRNKRGSIVGGNKCKNPQGYTME